MSIRGIVPNPIAHIHNSSHIDLDLLGMIGIVLLLVILFGVLGYGVLVFEPATEEKIEQLSCGELIDYIADKERLWGYAEHRYTWTCEK